MGRMIEQWLTKVKGVPVMEALPPWLAFPGGRRIHVDPYWGVDSGRDGSSPDKAVKTLTRALALATADQNDVVYFHARSNTAAYTTNYLSSVFDWNKDGVHLVGINSGVNISPRSRVAFLSTYDTNASAMFTVSANNCYIANMQFFMGVASTKPIGCMNVTGQRNRFENCHIAGFGALTNDILGAYSLKLTGAEENLFVDCTIGHDRISRGAYANSEILVASVAKNNNFRNCVIKGFTSSATNWVFLRAAAGSLDGVLEFKDCRFINSVHRTGGTGLTYGFIVNSGAGGDVILSGTTGVMAGDINSTDSGNVYGLGAIATAATFGLGVALTQS